MELTRERIELFANATVDCETRIMAKQLLAEMDAPKVWTNAPDEATHVTLSFSGDGRFAPILKNVAYTRELPKSSARKIAETIEDEMSAITGFTPTDAERNEIHNLIESAILRDREEMETK